MKRENRSHRQSRVVLVGTEVDFSHYSLDTSGPRTGARVEVCEEISRPDLRAQSEALKPSCARNANGNLCDDWTLSLGAPGGVAGHTTHPRPPAPRRAPLNFPRPGGCGRSVTT